MKSIITIFATALTFSACTAPVNHDASSPEAAASLPPHSMPTKSRNEPERSITVITRGELFSLARRDPEAIDLQGRLDALDRYNGNQ